MAAVEIVDSSMVTPGEATPGHAIWLSNLDLLVARSHTPPVYVYRPTASDDPASFFSPDVLKAALSKALVLFYPLAGRLAQDSAVAKVDDIIATGGPLDTVAEKVSGATARLDDDYVRSLLDYLEQPASGGGGGGRAHTFRCPNLGLTSWVRLPIHDADFGWGRPAFMGRACLQFSGLVYLVPGPDGDGRLDVVVAMEPESLAKFKKVFYDELSSSVGTLRA
uniref:Uncharacterized protein n=1 Tax=Oryza brachyantha TaxID=4533 RepID=J3MBW4_ORYBR